MNCVKKAGRLYVDASALTSVLFQQRKKKLCFGESRHDQMNRLVYVVSDLKTSQFDSLSHLLSYQFRPLLYVIYLMGLDVCPPSQTQTLTRLEHPLTIAPRRRNVNDSSRSWDISNRFANIERC